MRASTILLGGTFGSILLATIGLATLATSDPLQGMAAAPNYAVGAGAVLAVGVQLAVALRVVEAKTNNV